MQENILETIEIQDQEMEAYIEMIEVEVKKMKEKVQGPIVQVQEYKFSKARESSSSDRYKSRNDLYTRCGEDKKISLR